MRRDRLGRRIGRNPWRLWITSEWSAADQAWFLEAESVALGYSTELEEYRAANPRPNLRDYMVSLSPAYAAGGCPFSRR